MSEQRAAGSSAGAGRIVMALKNYYVLLGVERAEGAQGIRDAYRSLVRRYHPDRAGPNSTRAFLELQEAYQVLSDPDARSEYDRRAGPPREPESPRPAPEVPVEPLVPETRSLARDFRVRPSREAMLDRFLLNFAEPRRPKGEAVQAMHVEVILTPDEAAHGGLIAIGVPVFEACPSCRGTGRVWLYRCDACWGEGLVESQRAVRVQVPPFVRDGTVIEIPLGGLGIRNFFLRVELRIGA
jgi:molecular chaperone DnaJ